ncbi:neutrophil gelatinase-associated lipocalin [Myripristis murdjan]|uniref:Prostaglandin D2 synthase a n=1 Tax=Myripristis murdjan TaxID=586833 RepID=A0A668A094_9TELE|nr:neutrophil gelatinase-associated lipocalin [Myripristis murdjan]
MRIPVVAVVMVIVSGMMVQADVQPQRDFSLQRFAGKWYRVGLAYDSPGFAPYRDKLRISMGMITPLPNGNVNLTMWAARPSGCQNKLYQYEKTSVPGQFTYFSTRHNRSKDITVVETNYTEYALVLKHKKFDREYTQVSLYGRTQTLRPQIIQKFKTFATSRGFPKESIMTPPPSENCPPAASGR